MRKFGRRDMLRNCISATLVGGVSYERRTLMGHMMATGQEAKLKLRVCSVAGSANARFPGLLLAETRFQGSPMLANSSIKQTS